VLRVASMRYFLPRAVRRSIEYIHANLAGAIRLKDIADAAGMSMLHLSRTFRAATGARLHR
jgi:transcriptional regulator GlxA family with amidase domain